MDEDKFMLDYTKLINTGTVNLDQFKSYKRNVISLTLNFAENNNHGCDMQCSFCPWHIKNYGKYLYPSDEDLREFMHIFGIPGGFVEICGGGDPLYHYEQNKDKLFHLCDIIEAEGLQPYLLTKKLQVIIDNYDEIVSRIKSFSFSIEQMSKAFVDLIDRLLADGCYVRITKVYNFDESLDSTDLDAIHNFIKFYDRARPDKYKITLRTNYSYVLKKDELLKHRQLLADWQAENNIKSFIKLNANQFGMPQLCGNEVLRCSDTNYFIELGY